jgi:hypothetical protein
MNAADMPSAVDKRATAKDFFKRLEKYLNTQLPTIAAVNEDASRRKKEYLLTKDAKLLDFEPRFFKQQVVPCVHKFLTDEYGLTPKDAIQALLAEGWADLRKFASGTPASKPIYPYKKTLAATLKTARKDWWGTGKVLSNSCPDLAVRLPGGLTAVFEGKLFRAGGPDAAKSAIVAGIYECFFYRALPTLRKTNEPDASGYDYACFLAYDASLGSTLSKAWQDINAQVSQSCWDALNIYVMIVRKEHQE